MISRTKATRGSRVQTGSGKRDTARQAAGGLRARCVHPVRSECAAPPDHGCERGDERDHQDDTDRKVRVRRVQGVEDLRHPEPKPVQPDGHGAVDDPEVPDPQVRDDLAETYGPAPEFPFLLFPIQFSRKPGFFLRLEPRGIFRAVRQAEPGRNAEDQCRNSFEDEEPPPPGDTKPGDSCRGSTWTGERR